MDNVIAALLAKEYSSCSKQVDPGIYEVDEVVTLRIVGTAEKKEPEMVRPSHRIPFTTVMALLMEKAGVTRDAASRMLREALTEAMTGSAEDRVEALESRIKDAEKAAAAVKDQVLSQLPKVPKSGKFLTDVFIEEVAAEQEPSPRKRCKTLSV